MGNPNVRRGKKKARLLVKGHWKFTLEDIYTGAKRVFEYHNLVVLSGLSALASHLADVSPTPASMRINYGSLGDGTTPPDAGDTTLENELFRKIISSGTSEDGVAYLTAFYTAAEVDGTFREAGLHMNASGTPDSGTLFNRVAINVTKSPTETLTIDTAIEFEPA